MNIVTDQEEKQRRNFLSYFESVLWWCEKCHKSGSFSCQINHEEAIELVYEAHGNLACQESIWCTSGKDWYNRISRELQRPKEKVTNQDYFGGVVATFKADPNPSAPPPIKYEVRPYCKCGESDRRSKGLPHSSHTPWCPKVKDE